MNVRYVFFNSMLVLRCQIKNFLDFLLENLFHLYWINSEDSWCYLKCPFYGRVAYIGEPRIYRYKR